MAILESASDPLMRRPNVALAMSATLPTRLFGEPEIARLHRLATVFGSDRSSEPDHPGDAGHQGIPVVLDDFGSDDSQRALADCEILITSWGCPLVDEETLSIAPNLRAVIHAAGTVKEVVSDACWDHGIVVSTAATANALPVAEYTLAMILLSGKRVVELSRDYSIRKAAIDWANEFPDLGNFRRTVGIVGASTIGRRVIELLKPYDFQILVSDPYLDDAAAASIGATRVELDELFRMSDIVSIHAPLTAETAGSIDERTLSLLRDGTTLINTARGAIIDQPALEAELLSGRISAVIDTTNPWIPEPNSPLYSLSNVVLTPHLAGALGNEIGRLGAHAVSELDRYVNGLPFEHPVHREDLARMA